MSDINRILVSQRRAREMLDIGATTLWQLVRDGRLTTRKLGHKTLVEVASIELFVESLPRSSDLAPGIAAALRVRGERRKVKHVDAA